MPLPKQSIYIVSNSSIGKRGNIGYRASKIIEEAYDRSWKIYIFARRSVKYKNYNVNFYEILSRFLNFIRIYVIRRFDHVKVDSFLFQLLEKYLARRKLRNIGPGVLIHLWGPYNTILQYYKKNGYRIILDVPIACELHANEIFKNKRFHTPVNEFIQLHEKEAYRLADKIIVPSAFVADGILRHYPINPRKVSIVPFGVDYEKFYKNRIETRKTQGLTFIFTGTLNQRKGVFDLLNVWDCETFANDTLILCGRIFPEVRTRIKKLSKRGNVKLTGHVAVEKFLGEADIFVFPTYMEGSAKSVYEAMASGLPVITTPNSGSIVIQNETGLIIEPGCLNSLKSALTKLKHDHRLRLKLGSAGQNQVKKFTWEKYAKSICEIYKEVNDEPKQFD